MVPRLLLVLVLSGTWPGSLFAAGDEPKRQDSKTPIRVLIVTGVDYEGHQWKLTGPALRNVLEEENRFDVRIVEDPEFLASNMIFDYEVVFLHFKNYETHRREKEIRENLTKFVSDGGGLALFHFACGAFRDWPEFEKLAGKVWDEEMTGGYHDPRGPFTVTISNEDHPITKGMNDFQADDELYYCLKGNQKVEVLAAARSQVTGKDHPMAFVFEYGKGRVFHTPLGHDVKAIQMPGVGQLLRRGIAWTARKNLNEND